MVRPALRRPGTLLLRGWLAITLDRTILSWRQLDPSELEHELEHVRQWRRHGRAGFAARYLLASLRAVASGGHWYQDSQFEVAARQAADRRGPGGYPPTTS